MVIPVAKPAVTTEEQEYRQSAYPDVKAVVGKHLLCTSCSSSVKESILKGEVISHSFLDTLICQKCHSFYEDGEFSVDEDGSDKYCRWCGQGGTLFLCSKCTAGFCKKCVKRNLPRKALVDLEEDDWECYCCNPKPLFELRCLCWAAKEYVDKYAEEIAARIKSKKPSREKRPRDSSDDDDDDGDASNSKRHGDKDEKRSKNGSDKSKGTNKKRKTGESRKDKKRGNDDRSDKKRSTRSHKTEEELPDIVSIKSSDDDDMEIDDGDKSKRSRYTGDKSKESIKNIKQEDSKKDNKKRDNDKSPKKDSKNNVDDSDKRRSLRERKTKGDELLDGVKTSQWAVMVQRFDDVATDVARMTKEVHRKMLECKDKRISLKHINSFENLKSMRDNVVQILSSMELSSTKIRCMLTEFCNVWTEMAERGEDFDEEEFDERLSLKEAEANKVKVVGTPQDKLNEMVTKSLKTNKSEEVNISIENGKSPDSKFNSSNEKENSDSIGNTDKDNEGKSKYLDKSSTEASKSSVNDNSNECVMDSIEENLKEDSKILDEEKSKEVSKILDEEKSKEVSKILDEEKSKEGNSPVKENSEESRMSPTKEEIKQNGEVGKDEEEKPENPSELKTVKSITTENVTKDSERTSTEERKGSSQS